MWRVPIRPFARCCPRRGIKTAVSDLRKGDWIDLEGRVLVVHSVNSAHSGRGARQFLITLKEAVGEGLVTVKPSSRDHFEKLEMQDVAHQYLYEADGQVHLLNSKTLEELVVAKKIITGNLPKILEGGAEVKVRMSAGRPIMVHGARNYKCTVAEVLERRQDSDRRHSTVLVQGGARLICNVLLEQGDQIWVNADDLGYGGKV